MRGRFTLNRVPQESWAGTVGDLRRDESEEEKTMRTFSGRPVAVIGLAALSALSGVWLSACSKDFAAREQAVRAEWVQVQSELQRRNDLLPALLSAVVGTPAAEPAVVQALTESRARLTGAKSREEVIAAANDQSTALQKLQPIVDAHPELKTNDAVTQARKALAESENRVAVERMRYNAQVRLFRTSRGSLLGTLTAFATSADDYPFYMVPLNPSTGQRVESDFEP